MSDSGIRKTALHRLHGELGGKMVEFAGWEMPVQYPAGIKAEHHLCRNGAALFDVSHMGQVELRGPARAEQLETLVPSSITSLPAGKARYTFFTNDDGGIMDDLIVSNAGDYLYVVVNASMRDQDIQHMRTHLEGVELTELHDQSLIAVQGPKAEEVVGHFCKSAAELKFMQTTTDDIDGVSCRFSRLGYTGEDGFEISIPNHTAEAIAKELLANPHCGPAGLGARDSLRMEAGLCLYGNDIDTQTSPVEASLLWAIQKSRRQGGGYPGAERIQKEINHGAQKKLVGIKPEGRAPARSGVEIQSTKGDDIGIVTSGGYGPTVGGPIAMGYVAAEHSSVGEHIVLIVRGKPLAAQVAELPFVRQNYKR